MTRGRKFDHVLSGVDEARHVALCAKCGSVRIYAATTEQQQRGIKWVCGKRSSVRKKGGGKKGNGRPMVHLLSGIDEQKRTGTCVKCGFVRVLEAKNSRARIGASWVCARRPPDRVGGFTKHNLTDIDETKKIGTCSMCGLVPLVWRPFANGSGRWGCVRTRFSIAGTPSKHSAEFKQVVCPFCDKTHRWDRQQGKQCREALKEKYGNNCNICGDAFTEEPRIDHDHRSGAVRGLLCRNCNIGLGALKDSPTVLKAAVAYLESNQVDGLTPHPK